MTRAPESPGVVPPPAWPRPLEGVRVIDLSLLLPGPYCTSLLAQMGATVVKVEPPGGDPVRQLNPAGFAVANRGKQSVVVDAHEPGGRALLARLVDDADVLVEGFRPGVMDRLGLGFEAARARNPHLVYASISGYGQDGPYADRPGHDVNVVAAAGYFAQTLDLDDATLQRPRLRIADYMAGSLAAFSIAALLRTPRAERAAVHVDASLFDAIAHLTLPSALSATPQAAADPTTRPDARADVAVYRTSDGRAVAIAAVEDKFWPPLVEALRDRFPEIADPAWADGRGRVRDKRRLAATLASIFGRMSFAEAMALPEDAGCRSPVLRGTELLDDPHVLARGLVAHTPHGPRPTFPVAFDGLRSAADEPAPALGEHTAAWADALGVPHPESR